MIGFMIKTMITKNIYNKRGSITLLFMIIITMVVMLLLAATQSRLLLAIRRSQSVADTLIATYAAESEANDLLARVVGGYLDPSTYGKQSKTVDDTRLTIEAGQVGDEQTVVVTARRAFAVSKIEAVRKIESIKQVNEVEIILSLDCTSSMNAPASGSSGATRFDALEDAATAFISTIETLEDGDKFSVGVLTYGIDHKWLTHNGKELRPDSGLTLNETKNAISASFDRTFARSSACAGLMDATSIGTGFTSAYEYFDANQSPDKKQIVILITDGLPNSRIPYSGCGESIFCPAFPRDSQRNYCNYANRTYGWNCYRENEYIDGPYDPVDLYNDKAYSICEPTGFDFLTCALADNETFANEIGAEGVRNPAIDAYAVTILDRPPQKVIDIFQKYTTENGYFNARQADQLKNILNNILNQILTDRSVVIIKRVIPTPI